MSGLIVAAQSGLLFDCRVRRRPAQTVLAIECGTSSIALDIHLMAVICLPRFSSRRQPAVSAPWDILEPEIAQARVIIGAAAKRPVIFALALLDREIVYAGDAQAHQAVPIELPILIAIAAKPVAAVIVPLVCETHRDAVLAECPDLFDQAVVKLASPLARQKCFDFRSTLDELRAIAPATVCCVGKRNAGGVARVPCVFGDSRLLCGGLGCEGRKRRAAHVRVLA